MMKNKVKAAVLTIFAALITGLTVHALWANTALVLTEYTVTDPRLPKAFNGYRIAQVSDLHNTEFGEGNTTLFEMLKSADPDIIVITGDFHDSRYGSVETCISFAKEANSIAPTYCVSGNHDPYTEDYAALVQNIENTGATVLENETVILTREREQIILAGIDDPVLLRKHVQGDSSSGITWALDAALDNQQGYTILLAHHPEFIHIYAEYEVCLVFSGHAHGGQFRFPIVGGLYAPGQGVLPEYDAGLYTVGGTRMIVSRGIGNSGFPLRLNNRPEVVIAELRTGEVTY